MKANYLLFFLALFMACSTPKEPEFQSIANPKVVKFNMREVQVTADIVMNNPNNFSLDMSEMEVDVYVNDVHVGKSTQTDLSKIPADSNFNVPMKFDFSPKKVFNIGSLGGILGALNDKKMKVKYKGFITLKALDSDWKVPFDYDDEMDLKKPAK